MERKKAIRYYEKKLKEDPYNINFITYLAFSHLETNHDAALKYFHRAATLEPTVKNLTNEGWFLVEHSILDDSFSRAVNVLEKAIHQNPQVDKPFFAIAIAYYFLTEIESAERYLRKATQINPSYFNFYNLGVVQYEMSRFEEARESFFLSCKAQDRPADTHEANVWNGVCLARIGEVEKAEKIAHGLLADNKISGECLCDPALIFYETHNYHKVVELGWRTGRDILMYAYSLFQVLEAEKAKKLLEQRKEDIREFLDLDESTRVEFQECQKLIDSLGAFRPEIYGPDLDLKCSFIDCQVCKGEMLSKY